MAAQARTFYVDAAAGNDDDNGLTPETAWRTLGRANAAVWPGGDTVGAGDTVRLRGTFTGQRIEPGVTGTAAGPITVESDPALLPERAELVGGMDDGLGGRAVLVVNRNYIAIRALRIRNVRGLYGVGVWIENANNNTIEDNEIVDIGCEARDETIPGCEAVNQSGNSGDSIYLVNASRNRIVSNTVRNGGHSLIQVSSQQATTFSNDNVIARNTLSNFYATPVILAYRSEGTVIEYNRISDGACSNEACTGGPNYPRPGIQIVASNNIIRRNEIFSNAAGGIDLAAYMYNPTTPQDSIGNEIYHNVIYGNNRIQDRVNSMGALHLREANGRSVRNNLIANNIFFRNSGLILDNDFDLINEFYQITIAHAGDTPAWRVGELNGNQIRSNIFLREPGTARQPAVLRIRDRNHCEPEPESCPNPNNPNLAYTLSTFQDPDPANPNSYYPGAADNLEEDPLFTNAATRFTLRAGSPAIDRGVPIPGDPAVYRGAAPDIGRDETNF